MPATSKTGHRHPDAVTFSGDVEMVTLPAVEGEMGVYPQHVPLLTQLVAGELVVRQEGHDIYLAVGDGFVEVTNDHVAVLTDMAVPADQIDEARAEEARQRAEARLAEHMDDEETATVHAALANSTAQLAVKRKHRK
jgi:F-type H+-transporting ATPase subunit epsilon